ncbi:MAG TPA: patatin-like phospholipase family protein [Humisphaera sp.]|jgi:predicted acylesterase/phospholipase RssA|nr:patatin-like phospholipase family protein [Humisphaera sp.]
MKHLAILALLFALIGCTPQPESRFAHLDKTAARVMAAKMQEQREAELAADLKSAFEVRQPRNVLVLSGGGADGAFGCGVLDGWRNAPGGRPQFDVVTGVSTGALMATFAFLGQECDDAVLRQVYTHSRDEDIHGSPFALGPPDSVVDTGPLRKLIARYVTPGAIERVAAEHRAGRRLYVATVDLDAGELVIWPLSKIAADGGPGSVERFQKILLATASVPVFFPPVRIDGDLHVDAGLREALFLRRAMLGMSQAYDSTRAADAPSAPPTIWAVVNQRLEIQPRAMHDDLIDIGMRSLEMYTQSLEFANVREIALMAAAHQPAFAFRYVSLPINADEQERDPLGPMFDPVRMKRLYSIGQAMMRDSAGWNVGTPHGDDDPVVIGMGLNP